MARNQLEVFIKAVTDDFDRKIKGVEGRLDKFSGTAKRVAGGIAAAYGAREIIDFAGASVDAASNLNEEISKSEAVFGDAAAAVGQFAAGADKSAGLSERAAREFANRFGQFGKNAGLAGDDLSAFSTDLVGLSADLASFNNLEVEDAAAKLAAGLSGEAEPLKALGIFLSAAEVEAKGLEMGLGGLTGKLTEQEKVLARQALIFEQAADAQGDFSRTSDGLANRQRIMKAQWENVQAELGEKLLPIMIEVVGFISEKLIPGIEELVTWLEDNIPPAVETVKAVFLPLWQVVSGAVKQAVDAIMFVVAIFQGDWGEAWERLKSMAGRVFDGIKKLFELMWVGVRAIFARALEFVRGIPGSILSALGDLGGLLVDAGRKIIQGLWDGMKAVWEEVKGWLSGLGDVIGFLKGPPAEDARLLIENGNLIMQGLGAGLRQGFANDVVPTLAGVTSSIPSNVGAAAQPGGQAGGGTVIKVFLDGKELGVKVLDHVVAAGNARGGVPLKIRNAR